MGFIADQLNSVDLSVYSASFTDGIDADPKPLTIYTKSTLDVPLQDHAFIVGFSIKAFDLLTGVQVYPEQLRLEQTKGAGITNWPNEKNLGQDYILLNDLEKDILLRVSSTMETLRLQYYPKPGEFGGTIFCYGRLDFMVFDNQGFNKRI